MIFSRFHPRRRWLLRRRRQEIEQQAQKLLPKPYDVGAKLIEIRTGQYISSPLTRRVHLADQAPTSSPTNSRSPQVSSKTIAGGEALALYGAGVIEKMLAVDSHIYEAMSNLGKAQIDNLADLSASLKHWDHSHFSGLSEGALRKLSGHLGEVYAGEHLQQAGASVEWPVTSNQAGWDLIVDGHAVNVKTVADAAELHKHFSEYPDIAVIIPADAHNIPTDAFHLNPGGSADTLDHFLATHDHHAVIVDHGLSHTDLVDQASDATDAALGDASVVDLHMPWITMATSGWREIKLLLDSHTDIVAAAKNLTLDVVGRGGGAAVGGKGGALVGFIFGPIGVAICAVIGAIGGAIAGGTAANSIKREPLAKAVAEFKAAQSDVTENSVRLNRKANAHYQSARQDEQKLLLEAAEKEKSGIEESYHDLLEWRANREQVPEQTKRLLSAARDTLESQEAAVVERLDGFSFFQRWLWPSQAIISNEIALAELRKRLVLIAGQEAKLDQLRQSELFALLALYGIGETGVKNVAKISESQRVEKEHALRERIVAAQLHLGDLRIQAFKRLAQAVTRIVSQLQEEIKPYVEQFGLTAVSVKSEMGKLGMS